MSLLTTPLHALHCELGAKMVPFAGYDMPVQYPSGIIKEHLHTRAAAGLFDVSHMGQVVIEGPGSTAMLESLVPVDLEALPVNGQTYALLTNDAGGVRDDLIITRWGEDRFFLVVNAACKAADIAHLQSHLGGQTLTVLEEQALLALQITRDDIPIYSVDVAYMVNENTGYIKISQFAQTTYREFMEAIEKLKSRGVQKLILDLRRNGG